MRKTVRSISVPITLGAVAVPLAVALLVGWTLIYATRIADGSDVAGNVWLLVLGTVAFAAILSVLVLFSIFLVREILEVRRQDTFIDSVTHELKSPLASIKLCLQTLDRPELSAQQKSDLMAMMTDDVDRLSGLIDDVLQASRLAHDRDRVGLDVGEVEVRSMIEECAEVVCARHGLSDEMVTIEVEEKLHLRTDGAALQVVLRNLLDNAIKYGGTDPKVTVAARSDGRDGAVFEVA
ncbi:MAG: HAMP domain-containing sensor histidine kinase, partial [Myxococcota bacterium]